MTNWNLCFICQRSTNEVLRSSNDGLNTLATNMVKFNEVRHLKFDYSQVANENKNLLSILKANNAKYHNMYQSSYSDSKLQQKSQGTIMHTKSNIIGALSTIMKSTTELTDNNEIKQIPSLSM